METKVAGQKRRSRFDDDGEQDVPVAKKPVPGLNEAAARAAALSRELASKVCDSQHCQKRQGGGGLSSSALPD